MRKHVFFLSVAVLVGGCAKAVVITAPPEAYVNLAGQRASYRDWTRVTALCTQDPQVGAGDVDSMNTVLEAWLAKTEAAQEPAARIAALESGARQLPVALKLDETYLGRVKGQPCAPANGPKLEKLIADARARLDAFQAETAGAAKKAEALTAWKTARPDAEKAAKEKACPTKPLAVLPKKYEPVAYFGATDEAGRTEWLFCDGAKVASDKGQPATVAQAATELPQPKKGQKAVAPDAKVWLDAAAKFPVAQVSIAP